VTFVLQEEEGRPFEFLVHATGSEHYFACDPAGRFRGQQNCNRRYISRPSESSQRCLRDGVLLKFAAQHAERMSALGLRAAWIDRVHADVLRPKLLRQNLGDE
jgi:hypothetical protein